MKKEKYSEHFWNYEFEYVIPEKILLTVLERLRLKTKNVINITNSGRSPKKHIEIYKNLEKKDKLNGKKWYEVIPWNSRHLSAFNKDLRAVDIQAAKNRNDNNKITEFYSGDELKVFLNEIEDEMEIFIGIGVGKDYCHIDIDRERATTWYYR